SLAVMTPVMTVGEGFRQVWCDNAPEFTAFSAAATPKIVAARETSPAPLIVDGEHFICASCLPWLHFTSMTHAEYAVGAAVPALTWGKLQNGVIPVAGRFNHAFVDGLHASRFYALVEEGFNDPERLWLPLTETAPSLLPPAAKER
ncbi:CatA-like O-acetyltransferase, partial [Klebsiella pneumoniae subsp. pneumoniae]